MTPEKSTYRDRLVQDPEILAGKATVKGTRIPVDLVLKRLSQDLNLKTLFESYPRPTEENVKACFNYARSMLEREKREHN